MCQLPTIAKERASWSIPVRFIRSGFVLLMITGMALAIVLYILAGEYVYSRGIAVGELQKEQEIIDDLNMTGGYVLEYNDTASLQLMTYGDCLLECGQVIDQIMEESY